MTFAILNGGNREEDKKNNIYDLPGIWFGLAWLDLMMAELSIVALWYFPSFSMFDDLENN